jgi:hypothetical protein
MLRTSWRQTFVPLAAAAFFAAPAAAQQADQRNRTPDRPAATEPRPVSPARQHIAGVIIKTVNMHGDVGREPGANPAVRPRPRAVRLTINSAAVWRDWSRDQVGQSPSASPRADADRGEKSVATTGEPRDRDTDVVVEVDADARVETLFRNVEGAARPDSKTPEAARAAGDSGTPSASQPRGSAITHFAFDDLKPGLFVEIDYRTEKGRNHATKVAVIRPTGGPEAPRAQPRN